MKFLKNFRLLSISIILTLISVSTLQAQRARGDVGIGFQAGQPSGLSLNVYNPTGMSTDILAAWNLNDFYFVNVHGVFNSHLGNSDALHVFYGPGAFVGVRDRKDSDDIVQAGLSGTLGLSVMINKLELYGRVTPRLQLIDKTDVDFGGGIGMRVYL